MIRTEFLLGKYKEAEADWTEMMERFPGERSLKLLVTLGEIQTKAGKAEAAAGTFREALKLDPSDMAALHGLAILLIGDGKADEAIQLVRDAAKADPNNASIGFELGIILTQAKRADEAIAQFKGLIERFPADDLVFRLAHGRLSIIYTDLNDFAKAEAELEIVLVKEPDDPGINNDLGYLYADQGKNLEKAEAMIRKAVSEEPDNFAYLDSLGWVLFKRGKFQEAKVRRWRRPWPTPRPT